jgi:phosphoribosylanthranilate isomerase
MLRNPSYTRTKICGLTARGDALAVAEYGADAIGLVFFAQSPRCVSLPDAKDIAAAVGPFVTLVGLFVDAEPVYVEEVLQAVPLQLLQFHGAESPDYCERFQRPYLKALKVPTPQGGTDAKAIDTIRQQLLEQAARYPTAQGILLDTLSQKGEGGTGESFNWQCVPDTGAVNWILAGGLHAGNVGKAIRIARPYAVDVSSGVELSPGVKDPEKIRTFLESVRAASPIHCNQQAPNS